MKSEHENILILFLGILAVISIFTSLLLHFNNQVFTGTGFVTGTVNITINESLAMSLSRSSVNFTVANPGDTRSSYVTANLATAPTASCTGKLNGETCGFNLTNDGSVNLNITIRDIGTLFTSASFSRATHFVYNVSVPAAARTTCTQFYNETISSAGSAWAALPTSATTAICGLAFANGATDAAAIDIKIVVPSDESSGIKGSVIELLAVAAGL